MSFDGRMWYTCLCGLRVSERSKHYLECEVIACKVAEYEVWEKVCAIDWFKGLRELPH